MTDLAAIEKGSGFHLKNVTPWFDNGGRPNWRDHVQSDSSLLRPSDILEGLANPAKAYNVLGWKAKFQLEDILGLMVDAENKN